MDVKIHDEWKDLLKNEFKKDYFQTLVTHIKAEKEAGKIIYPPGSHIFNAFNLTPISSLKVVLIGQDPYHGKNQAHGLSFSVTHQTLPPSLKNIFKELQADIGLPIPNHGNLSNWAKQGVLLLNASLTVREGEPSSHSQIGWLEFTDAVIKTISENLKGIVFLLWGKTAAQKEILIDKQKHFILKAAHPSPFSADKGFFGCRHFSKTNEILIKQGKQPIDWQL